MAGITLCGFGVSNYYNKLKLILLEKEIPFQERLVYPWQRESFRQSSPMGKIPFVETEHGSLSESQVILEYLEERYPERPMLPTEIFARAKCRELIQHLELNSEWVARRLYKESLFGGSVSEETKREARERLAIGLEAVAQLTMDKYEKIPLTAVKAIPSNTVAGVTIGTNAVTPAAGMGQHLTLELDAGGAGFLEPRGDDHRAGNAGLRAGLDNGRNRSGRGGEVRGRDRRRHHGRAHR